MDDDLSVILSLVILVLCSSFFSATETAFSSLNVIKIKHLASKGSKRAQRVLKLSENFDKILSTILVGNNIVNMASASIATVLFTKWLGNAGVTVSTIVMTVAVLIFGEISPKTIAKDMPEQWAMLSAPILELLCLILTPVNALFGLWKKLLSKIFRKKSDATFSEEELLIMIEEAQNDGEIDEEAGELIRSAIEFEDMDALDICTPRINIIAIADTATVEETAELFSEHGYSRMPVYHKTIDNVTGVINQKDFYQKVIGQGQSLESIISPIVMIEPTIKISTLMRLLQQKHSHIALIVDEYGGTQGIVTLEDIIEELVGEIWDEHDVVVMDIEKVSEDKYLVLGTCSFQRLMEELEIPQEEDNNDFVSVNGWVAHELEQIPKVGDSFVYENLTVKVLEATERAATKVQVLVGERPEEEE
ncbi:MAG: HlyC/CorC family transporter [Ruminococcaceae bacterium]|nr:HlyC/CorC family transporter [Oscillospiraceae bacterium]